MRGLLTTSSFLLTIRLQCRLTVGKAMPGALIQVCCFITLSRILSTGLAVLSTALLSLSTALVILSAAFSFQSSTFPFLSTTNLFTMIFSPGYFVVRAAISQCQETKTLNWQPPCGLSTGLAVLSAALLSLSTVFVNLSTTGRILDKKVIQDREVCTDN